MGRPCIASAVKRRRIHLLTPRVDVGKAGLPNVSWKEVADFLKDHPPAVAGSLPEDFEPVQEPQDLTQEISDPAPDQLPG